LLWDLLGAPALHAGDVELGKSGGGHAAMIAAQNRPRLFRRQQHRNRAGSAERLGWERKRPDTQIRAVWL
jgi:hypothetical protein